MSDRREEMIAQELRAFSRVTSNGLQPLERFVGDRALENEKAIGKADKMSISRISTGRRVLVATGAVAALAAVMFFIPVSYSRTVGWDVSLKLSGAALSPEHIKPVATELKSLIAADKVQVALKHGEKGPEATLSTFVNAKGNSNPAAAVQAFKTILQNKGYNATASAEPRIEEVSGNVWAMTMDKVIYIETEGKSAEDLEDEILERLTAAGFDKLEVDVTDMGEGKKRILIGADCERLSTDTDKKPDCPELVLTKNGEIPQGERFMIKLKQEMIDDKTVSVFELEMKGKQATVRIEDMESLEDDAVVEIFKVQLAAQGIEAEVTMENGELMIGEHQIYRRPKD